MKARFTVLAETINASDDSTCQNLNYTDGDLTSDDLRSKQSPHAQLRKKLENLVE